MTSAATAFYLLKPDALACREIPRRARPRPWRPAPPVARARRHQFADIRDTLNRRATSRSLAPASASAAAASRNRSRRAHSATADPPSSGYLMHPA
jgi:hypothetical protein